MSTEPLRTLFCIGNNQNFFDLPKNEIGPVWIGGDDAFGDSSSLFVTDDRVLAFGRGGELLLLDANSPDFSSVATKASWSCSLVGNAAPPKKVSRAPVTGITRTRCGVWRSEGATTSGTIRLGVMPAHPTSVSTRAPIT